jgi:hypothetical protein
MLEGARSIICIGLLQKELSDETTVTDEVDFSRILNGVVEELASYT